MRKHKEVHDPNSCLGRAGIDEMLFVLLGRDVAAPNVIRFWCYERVRLGKNQPLDPQIKEALACADAMERDRLAALPDRRGPTTCGHCEYDEADGELIEQCDACRDADDVRKAMKDAAR